MLNAAQQVENAPLPSTFGCGWIAAASGDQQNACSGNRGAVRRDSKRRLGNKSFGYSRHVCSRVVLAHYTGLKARFPPAPTSAFGT